MVFNPIISCFSSRSIFLISTEVDLSARRVRTKESNILLFDASIWMRHHFNADCAGFLLNEKAVTDRPGQRIAVACITLGSGWISANKTVTPSPPALYGPAAQSREACVWSWPQGIRFFTALLRSRAWFWFPGSLSKYVKVHLHPVFRNKSKLVCSGGCGTIYRAGSFLWELGRYRF